jgi:type I restriction enzyme S subunit
MTPLGNALTKRTERFDVTKSKPMPITIHFDGSIDPRKVDAGREFKMDFYRAEPGDLVVSKIDLKNGAVGIVPPGWSDVGVTNHFAVYEIDTDLVDPDYLHRVIQQPDFKEYLWRKKVGAEGRKEVKLDLFLAIEIPMPDVIVQTKILETKTPIVKKLARLRMQLREAEETIDLMIHGAQAVP